MALYALAQRTISGVAATASWEIRSTAGNKPKLATLELTQNTAVAGVYGIGTPAALGITPTTPQTFLDEGDGNGAAGNTVAAVAWGTPPTVPANFVRRYSCAATIGVGFIYLPPGGKGLAVSSSLVVWVIATAPVCDVSATVVE